MKKALISPNEVRETGYRVAEVTDVLFEVSSPLYWVDCPDEVQADIYWYDPQSSSFQLTPVVEVYTPPVLQEATEPQPVVQGAQTL